MTRLFQFLARVPLPWMQRLGWCLGWLVWALSPAYRRQFRHNITAAGLTWRETRAAVGATGQMLAELPWLWMRPHNQTLGDLIRWEGHEHLENALSAGRGVIVMSPHIGCWEVGAQAIAERYGPRFGSLVALFRPARKAWLEPLVAQARQRPYLETVPTSLSGVRTLIRTLRAGGYTAILPDQVPPQGQGVWAPFFGRPVYTMTLVAKLAQQSGALVLLSWCERLAPGQGYCIHMQPWDVTAFRDPTTPPEEAARAINDAVAHLVRHAPGQYLWGYARGKQPREGV
jgi:KDO2-lipid IV(A) lauroyltransferase